MKENPIFVKYPFHAMSNASDAICVPWRLTC